MQPASNEVGSVSPGAAAEPTRMAITEVARADEAASDRHVVPVFVVEFDDERSRSRLREAAFLSVIFHLLLFIVLLLSPKWMPKLHPILLATTNDMLRNRELTYLDLPHDTQQPAKRPDSNVISDKDRIATSRHPTLDRKTLDELRDSRRPGRPGAPGLQAPPAPPVQAQAPPAQPSQPQARPEQRPDNNQLAHLEAPPIGRPLQRGPSFSTGPMSAGSAIDQAARAAAAARNAGGGAAGDAGDYGLGLGNRGTNVGGNLDILSDTMGVDFGPYLSRVLHVVRENWYSVIPEVARAPLMKRGKVAIDFAILKDGSIAGMKLVGPSGDVSLDRAAWGGITASNPFPPLPSEFRGEYLALRFRFYYNPERGELR